MNLGFRFSTGLLALVCFLILAASIVGTAYFPGSVYRIETDVDLNTGRVRHREIVCGVLSNEKVESTDFSRFAESVLSLQVEPDWFPGRRHSQIPRGARSHSRSLGLLHEANGLAQAIKAVSPTIEDEIMLARFGLKSLKALNSFYVAIESDRSFVIKKLDSPFEMRIQSGTQVNANAY